MATYALIHGGGGSAWDWHRVVPLLEAGGHRALAPDLPTDDPDAGWPAYGAAFGDVPDDDVIVVAHSLGAIAAPAVAAQLGARRVVLVSGMIPVAGETGAGWWETSGFAAEVDVEGLDDHALYFHDVPPALEAESARHARDVASAAMALPVPPWPPGVAFRVLAFAADRLFPVAFQRRLARERLGAEVELVPGGHYGAISEPGALAAALST